MSKNPSISLRSRWLSEKLKEARLAARYTLVDAARYLQIDHATLSRFEHGTHRIRRSYVKDLLDFYGVASERERDFLLQIAEDTWRKDWSDMDSYDLDTEFIDYTWLEAKAVEIHVFEPLIVHGLLQTPQYVEALAEMEANYTQTPLDHANVVGVRSKRQDILHGDKPPRLMVVMEEPALRRPIGGRSTLRGQLTHLLSFDDVSHIDIRILPMGIEADPGYHGPFTIFTMPDPYPTIAYVENIVGRVFFEEEGKVDRFRKTYDQIQTLALTAPESSECIKNILKDLE